MDITGNPFIITAADVAAGPVTVWPYVLNRIQIEFTEYTNVTDTATILQVNGKDLAFLRGAADFETVRTGLLPGPFRGILINQNAITTTGKVRIFHS